MLALLPWAINNLFLTHYVLGWRKIGSSTVCGSPQRLLGAGRGSVRGRCIHPGALPARLFDQAAGAARASDRVAHTALGKKHTEAIR